MIVCVYRIKYSINISFTCFKTLFECVYKFEITYVAHTLYFYMHRQGCPRIPSRMKDGLDWHKFLIYIFYKKFGKLKHLSEQV